MTSQRAHRLHRVERADDLIERSPWVNARINGHTACSHEYELLGEAVRHLGDPLQLYPLWCYDEDPADDSTSLELGNDEPSFDRLAKLYLVGQQQTQRVR